MSTAAFNAINSAFPCYPGAIMRGVLSMYKASRSLKHVMLVTPFLWDSRLPTSTVGKKSVAWLQVVPISNAELRFADKEGSEALEGLFEEEQIDVYDINRKSVVR